MAQTSTDSLAPSFGVFKHSAFRNFLIARVILSAARQMVAVAIGWHVYELARETRSIEESAFILGLVGLTLFIPVFFLSLLGGQVADKYNRKLIIIICNTIRALAIFGLFMTTKMPTDQALPSVFALAAIIGVVNAFNPAAVSSLYPNLVPKAELPAAIAWNSLGYQLAAIIGPAIGGLLMMRGEVELAYKVATILSIIAVGFYFIMKSPKHVPLENARGLSMIFEGLKYVRENKVVLGAISLDLVVVFFAGVTALLPIFAKDVLHVGPEGFGILRAAPAAGAAIVALFLALRPFDRKVGRNMLLAILIYGLAMLGFALSKNLWLSLSMLAITGAADMISVYVRQSLIQFATPDLMRGRVNSVSFIFISASNELGEFESGMAARFLGPIGAVLLGAGVAIGAALAWPRLFPALSNADSYDDIAAPENRMSE